jgi:hypothetical protein
VHYEFDITVELCESTIGGSGRLFGGVRSRLVFIPPADPVSFVELTFPGKDKDTLGFSVTGCEGYYETGQWTHDVKNDGKETLKGKSYALINPLFAAPAYTLECEYNLVGT